MKTIQQQRAETKARYNYDPGDSAALLLAVISEEHGQNRQQLEIITGRLQQNVRALQTDKPTAAFWYGVGKGLNWGIPLLMAICLTSWFYSQTDTYQAIAATVAKYPNADEFRFLMQKATIRTDENGMEFIELKPLSQKQEAVVGQHYIFVKDCNCVRVPLSFK